MSIMQHLFFSMHKSLLIPDKQPDSTKLTSKNPNSAVILKSPWHVPPTPAIIELSVKNHILEALSKLERPETIAIGSDMMLECIRGVEGPNAYKLGRYLLSSRELSKAISKKAFLQLFPKLIKQCGENIIDDTPTPHMFSSMASYIFNGNCSSFSELNDTIREVIIEIFNLLIKPTSVSQHSQSDILSGAIDIVCGVLLQLLTANPSSSSASAGDSKIPAISVPSKKLLVSCLADILLIAAQEFFHLDSANDNNDSNPNDNHDRSNDTTGRVRDAFSLLGTELSHVLFSKGKALGPAFTAEIIRGILPLLVHCPSVIATRLAAIVNFCLSLLSSPPQTTSSVSYNASVHQKFAAPPSPPKKGESPHFKIYHDAQQDLISSFNNNNNNNNNNNTLSNQGATNHNFESNNNNNGVNGVGIPLTPALVAVTLATLGHIGRILQCSLPSHTPPPPISSRRPSLSVSESIRLKTQSIVTPSLTSTSAQSATPLHSLIDQTRRAVLFALDLRSNSCLAKVMRLEKKHLPLLLFAKESWLELPASSAAADSHNLSANDTTTKTARVASPKRNLFLKRAFSPGGSSPQKKPIFAKPFGETANNNKHDTLMDPNFYRESKKEEAKGILSNGYTKNGTRLNSINPQLQPQKNDTDVLPSAKQYSTSSFQQKQQQSQQQQQMLNNDEANRSDRSIRSVHNNNENIMNSNNNNNENDGPQNINSHDRNHSVRSHVSLIQSIAMEGDSKRRHSIHNIINSNPSSTHLFHQDQLLMPGSNEQNNASHSASKQSLRNSPINSEDSSHKVDHHVSSAFSSSRQQRLHEEEKLHEAEAILRRNPLEDAGESKRRNSAVSILRVSSSSSAMVHSKYGNGSHELISDAQGDAHSAMLRFLDTTASINPANYQQVQKESLKSDESSFSQQAQLPKQQEPQNAIYFSGLLKDAVLLCYSLSARKRADYDANVSVNESGQNVKIMNMSEKIRQLQIDGDDTSVLHLVLSHFLPKLSNKSTDNIFTPPNTLLDPIVASSKIWATIQSEMDAPSRAFLLLALCRIVSRASTLFWTGRQGKSLKEDTLKTILMSEGSEALDGVLIWIRNLLASDAAASALGREVDRIALDATLKVVKMVKMGKVSGGVLRSANINLNNDVF